MMGRAVVSSAKEAFGQLPDTVPGELLPNPPKNALLADVESPQSPEDAPENPTLEGGNSGPER
jgi:hypothetical protein